MEKRKWREKKKWRECTALLAVVILAAGLPDSLTAAAAETTAAEESAAAEEGEEYACTVSITAEVIQMGDTPEQTEEVTLRLKAVDDSIPMPEQTEMTLDGEGSVDFGPMTYTSPGDYEYQLWQVEEEISGYVFDDTVYTVMVRVENAEEGGLKASIWAVASGSGAKQESIRFYNCYSKATVASGAVPASGSIAVIKVDSLTGAYLEGAEFALYGSEGEHISTYLTNEEGWLMTNALSYDTYTLVETQAPEGYVAAEESYTVALTYDLSPDASAPYTLVIENTPEGGTVQDGEEESGTVTAPKTSDTAALWGWGILSGVSLLLLIYMLIQYQKLG